MGYLPIGLITFLSGIIWALLFHYIKNIEKKTQDLDERFTIHTENNCKVHSIEIANHQIALNTLEKKMWSKNELEKMVERTVESATERVFLRWENNLLKKSHKIITNVKEEQCK